MVNIGIFGFITTPAARSDYSLTLRDTWNHLLYVLGKFNDQHHVYRTLQPNLQLTYTEMWVKVNVQHYIQKNVYCSVAKTDSVVCF